MKKRRGYFKHYNDASLGQSIQDLLYQKQYEACCLWWIILERCNQTDSDAMQYDEKLERFFARTLHVTIKKIQSFIKILENAELILIKNGQILAPNYLEYQENRGQKKNKSDAKVDNIKDKRLKMKDKILKMKDDRLNKPSGLDQSSSSFLDLPSLWNLHCGALPKVKIPVSALTQGKINLRLNKNPDEQKWIECIKKIAANDFCNGKADSSNFKATFNWLISPQTFEKVMSGKYEDFKESSFNSKDYLAKISQEAKKNGKV